MSRESRREEAKKHEKLGRAFAAIIETDFINHSRLYRVNFLRGIFFGLGVAVGGTIVLTALLWLLTLFTQIPLIGNLARLIEESIKMTNGS